MSDTIKPAVTWPTETSII